MKKQILTVLMVLSLSACHTMTFTNGGAIKGNTTKSKTQHLIVDLVEIPGPISMSEQCPEGFAETEVKVSFIDHLAIFFTWGVWTPKTVNTTCMALKK